MSERFPPLPDHVRVALESAFATADDEYFEAAVVGAQIALREFGYNGEKASHVPSR